MKKLGLVLLFLFTGCFSNKQPINSEVITNSNDTIKEEKIVDKLIFHDESIMFKDNISTITFEVTNTGEEKEIKKINVTVETSNKREITKLEYDFNTTMKADETKIISIYSDIDLTNAYYLDFEIE